MQISHVYCSLLFLISVIVNMELTDSDYVVYVMVNRKLQAYIECLDNVKLRDALKHILAISRIGNRHIQAEKPWELMKGSQKEM